MVIGFGVCVYIYSVNSNLGIVNIYFVVLSDVYFAGMWYLVADLITC